MLDAYDLARLNGFSGTRLDFQKAESASNGVRETIELGYNRKAHEIMRGSFGSAEMQAWVAHEIAKQYGYTGTAKDWMESIRGTDGLTAFQIAKNFGFKGSEKEWLESLQGKDGLDAYEVWLSLGNVGEKNIYLETLRGEPGRDGKDGQDGKDGRDGVNGKDGVDGKDGETGPAPRHQWDGKRVRFERPDGTWGEWVDLTGSAAIAANGGGSLSIQKFYDSADDFPTPGKPQILYFDQSTDPYGVFIWTGTEYQQVGGGGDSSNRVAGRFIGGFEAYAEMGLVPARDGDWAVLRTDDGTHESGIYVFSASTIGDTGTFVNADNEPTLDGTWQFVADLTTIDELTEYLAATHTTEFDQINNTEASYEVAIAGVKASLVPSILVTHTLANTVSVQAQVTGDNTVLLKVTNRSGVDIPASTQINILVKQ